MAEDVVAAMRQAERLRQEILRTGIRDVGLRSVGGVLEPVYFAPPTDADRRMIESVFAAFDPQNAAAQEAFDADRAIDAVPDAVLDLILAAKALPPTATAADVRARAKADRRARGGRP